MGRIEPLRSGEIAVFRYIPGVVKYRTGSLPDNHPSGAIESTGDMARLWVLVCARRCFDAYAIDAV